MIAVALKLCEVCEGSGSWCSWCNQPGLLCKCDYPKGLHDRCEPCEGTGYITEEEKEEEDE